MNRFTDAYGKAKDVIENQRFETEWQKFLTGKCDIKKLYGDKGFSKGAAKSPDLIRAKVADVAKAGKSPAGHVIYDAASGGEPNTSIADRAATLKMVRHTYRIVEKGSQDVWVYSPPKGLPGWIFDELARTNASTAKAKLCQDEEIFTEQEMKWMSAALLVARKISEDTKSKLAGFLGLLGANKATADKVRHWFLDEDCGEDQVKEATAKLLAGFKKIAVACNAPTLVFTDYPDWRAQRENYYGAAFRGGEGGGFPVVYLEGAFTRLTGNTGKQWLCAETIIHELSHHEANTQDHRYDNRGLKPNKAAFPYVQAIDNADSWGYFALDLAGYLSKADHDATWQ